MRITELRAENVKRLHAVEIKPDGATVVIGGKNGAGKSSVLDSIFWALGGAGNMPGKPVRDGEAEASITIRLDATPNLIVTRKIKAEGGTSLEIRQIDENGVTMKVSSPQKLLDSLCSAVAFDPLAFTRLRPQLQAETLRKLIGLDFSAIDAKEKAAFDARTAENREIKALQTRYGDMVHFEDAPAEEVSVNALVSELNQAQTTNRAKYEKQEYIRRFDEAIAQQAKAARSVLVQIEQLQKEAAAIDESRKLNEEHRTRAQAEAEALPEIECDPIHAKIRHAEVLNTQVRANAHRAEVGKALAERSKRCDELTGTIERCREARVEQLAIADWPVDGLGFSADGVTFNNLPFEQCSSAEKLRISTAIGFAQNPKLKVLLIQDGSLLDKQSMAEIARIAEEHDGQIWVEVVSEDGAGCSVVIEDGSVRGAVAEQARELATA